MKIKMLKCAKHRILLSILVLYYILYYTRPGNWTIIKLDQKWLMMSSQILWIFGRHVECSWQSALLLQSHCAQRQDNRQTKRKGSQCISHASEVVFHSYYGPFKCSPFISQRRKTACQPGWSIDSMMSVVVTHTSSAYTLCAWKPSVCGNIMKDRFMGYLDTFVYCAFPSPFGPFCSLYS